MHNYAPASHVKTQCFGHVCPQGTHAHMDLENSLCRVPVSPALTHRQLSAHSCPLSCLSQPGPREVWGNGSRSLHVHLHESLSLSFLIYKSLYGVRSLASGSQGRKGGHQGMGYAEVLEEKRASLRGFLGKSSCCFLQIGKPRCGG